VDVFVRPATAADLDAIVALVEAVRTELAPERGGQAWLVTEARPGPIRESLTTDVAGAGAEVHVTVAGIDEVVLGVAVTRERVRHDGSRAANVEELVVDPNARGVGLGSALLDDAIAWATEAGADVIESTALPGQRATKNFFEAAGMKARLLVVSRSLRPEADADAALDPVDAESGSE
jgi:GNAT superfamily N-acetyltransferase